MAIKGAKSIAEYAIRKWMEIQGFEPGYFTVTMTGIYAIITDCNGDTLKLKYDSSTGTVSEVTERREG